MAKQEDSALSGLISDHDVQKASASDKTLKSRVENGLDGSLSPGSAQADLGSNSASAAAMSLFYAFDRYGSALGEQTPPKSASTKDVEPPQTADGSNQGGASGSAAYPAQPSSNAEVVAVSSTSDAGILSSDDAQPNGVNANAVPFVMPEDAPAPRTIALEGLDNTPLSQSAQGSSSRSTVSVPTVDGMGEPTVEMPAPNLSAVGAISDTDAAADSVMENAVGGTVVGVTAFAEDADLDDSVTYTLSDDAGGRFAIDANTGVVTVDGAIDREDAASYTIEVTATSTDGSTATQSYTIAIGDEDEFDVSPVTDSNVAANTLAEDATVGTTVGVVASASDGDATDGVAYAVDDGRFTVDPDGTVRVASGASFDAETEASIDIIVTATSDDGSTSNETFTLTVSDVNESAVGAISDTDAAADSVMENAVGGTVVGVTAFAEDADLDDSVTYTLSDDAGGRFAIDANTGVVTVDGAIDREDAASYTIEVTATSTDGSTATQSYTIAIGDEDEFDVSPVTDSNVAANTLAEDATVGTTVGVVASASDGDATDGVAYAVDDGRFTVDPDGTVRVASGASFDAETEASIDIIVTATSDDGSTSNETFTLTVSDVNESAVGAISDTDAAADSVMENAVGGTVVGVTAFAEDADLDDSVTYTLSDDAGGRFAIDANTGVVTVDGAIDREDAASYTIEVTATSTDGSTATQSYTIAIGDEDEFDVSPVTDSNVAANTLAEDATVGTTVGVVASASDGDATDGVAYAVDDGRFTVDPDGTVRVASGASFDAETEASIDIIVTATSDDGSTSNETFTLTVSDVNESAVGAISDTDAAADSVMENAVGGTVVGVTAFAEDADLDDSVTYTLSDDAGGRFAIDANTGVVTVDGAIDREDAASYTIEVTATSTDGSTATQSYTIAIGDEDEFDVSPVTDSNVAANTLAEDATVGTTVGVVASASDGDATDGVAYAVDDGRFTVDPDGTVRVASGASFDAETEASIDIIVTATSDDGSTSNETFTLTVSDVNESAVGAISDTDAAADSVMENAVGGTVVGVTAFAEDADLDDSVTYTLSDDAGGRFAIDANTGVVTVDGAIDREDAASYTIEVTATSTDGSTATQSYTIAIGDEDEFDVSPVTDSNVAANTLAEDATVGTTVGVVASASDGDATDGVAYAVDDGRFTVDPDGTVRVASGASFDAETEASIDIIVTATSDDGSTSNETFTLTVSDVNESAVGAISDTDAAADSVMENAVGGTVVGVTAFAEDADLDDSVTYTLSDDAGGRFAIDANTGVVTVDGAIDREDAASYTIEVTATSTDGSTATQSYTIAIGDEDEFDVSPVTDSNVAANTLAEDATVGTTVGVVASASDGDATDGVAYAVDDGRFTVDPDGTVRVASGASFDAETEASIDIIVTATSDDGSTSNETFTLTVSDVNESAVGAISDTDAAADSVMENAVGGTVVGVTAFAEDADLDDSVTYTLSDDAGGRFAIDANTGVVTVDGAIDREDAASYTIEVTATSTDGSTATQSYTIAIGDEDEFDVSPVTDSNVAANTLAEDATVGTTVGVVASASDGDATDGVAYAVDDGRFTVDPDGTVRVASGASFDAETEASIDIIVTATSDDGSTSNETFTLTVSDVNESAVGAISDTDAAADSVMENAVGGTVVGVTAFAEDADLDDSVTYTLSDDAGGRFAIDANTGVVTVDGAIDREDAASYTIEVTATSTDGSTATQSYTIAIGDEDEFDVSPVTDSNVAANTLAEDATVGTTVGVVASASDGDATDGVAYAVDDGRFTVDPDGTVRVASGASFDAETEASIDIIVTATSDDGSTSNETFTLTVSDVNESAVGAISDTDAAADSVMENAVGGTVVGVTAFAEDADLDDSVTYTLSDDAGGRFAIDANTGVVTVDGAIDREDAASYTIEVTATSTDGSTATQSYTIAIGDEDEFDVSPVTDSNVAANTLAEDATVGTTVGVVASASDGDATDGVAYAVDDGRFTVDPDGTVRVASGASFDAETEASIDIIVTATSDDGSTSNETFTLTVSDVNESAVGAISDTDAAADSVMENAVGGTVVGVTAFAEDADLDDSVTYTLSDDAGGRFAIDANTGVVTVDGAIDREDAASYTIEVTATSTDGSTATQSYTIAIGDEDEFDVSPVTDSNVAANTLAEDATVGTTVGVVASASDGDATDGVAYAVDDGRFTVDPDGTVRVASGASFDAETEASIDIIVTATSDDGSTSNETFTLTVSDVNESAVGAISDTDAAADSVMENAVGGTVVGVTAFAEDADLDDSVTYTLSDDAGGRFAIDANTGVVTVDGAIDREDAASYTIEVTATSTDGSTATQSYTIAIGDEDEFDVSPVTDSNVAANTLAEDATVGTTVGVVASASDGDATDGVAYAVDDGRFTVDPDGTVRVASGASFDAETEASIDIIVTATSDDGSTSNETFTLTVSDVNESAVGAISDTDAAADSVMENAVGGTVVGVTAFAEDADLDDSVTYTLSDDAGGRFAIDANTGVVTVDGAIDREDAASYTIEVTATSTDGSTATQSYTIAIGDEDEFDVSPVTDSNVAANTLAEDATVGTTVGVVASASDGDATDGVAYAVDDGRFTVDPDGTVRVASGASFDAETEASIDIIVTATSDDGSTSNETFTLTVSDVNESAVGAISDTDAAADSVMENAVGGTVVGVTAFAEDADLDDSVTYTLSDDAGGRFAIDANTGVVTVDGAIDREDAASYTIEVTATSTDGSTATQSYTIAIGDEDEFDVSPVTDSNVAANTLAEDATVGTTVGVVASASDGDATDGVAYAVDDGRFTVDPDGTVRVASGASFDAETEASIDIIVTATSDDGSTSNETFTLTVSDVNESAVGAISDTDAAADSVMENAVGGTVVGVTAFAEDADLDDSVTYTLSDDAGGRFAIDANTGVVTVDGAIDREDAASYTIEVTATSTDGSTATQSYTIAIGDEDEFDVSPVTDSNVAANTLAEDATVGTTVGVVASASDGDATDGVAYAVDDGRFTVDPDGTVRVASGASFDAETEASIDIIVTATSDDGSTSNETFTLTVSDVNESAVGAISDTDAAADSVMENAVGGTVVGVTAFAEDADLDDSVTYTLSDDAGGRFAIDANTGVVTVDGAIDREDAASYTIEVTATSTDGSTATQSYTIAIGDEDEFDVSPVTDSNVAANTLAEDATVGTTVGVVASASDGDATDGVAYAVDDGRFTVDPDGTVRVASGASFDAETEASIDIIVTATSDDGSTSNETFTLTVSDVNESAVGAISDTDAAADSVMENAVGGTVVGVTAFAEDADLDDSVTYTLSDDAGGRFAIDANTGVVTVDGAIDREDAASYTIEVTATSTDGSTATQSYTIAIGDEDEFDVSPVTDSNVAANTLAEDATVGTTVGVVASASDGDATDGVAYAVDDGRFTVDPDGTVRVASGASFDAETEASIDIIVTATSDDGSTSNETFTLTVSDVNESAVGAISDTDAAADSVMENAVGGTVVGVTAFAEDADLDDSVTYTLSDDAGGRFAIDANTGVVTVDGAIDREDAASYTIEVTATSTDGSTATQSYTIAIGDEDEFDVSPVTDSNVAANTLAEDATVGTTVGVVASASDGDATDGVAYAVDDGRFTVDPDGTVRVASGASFDAETEASIDIIVTATSDDGSTSNETFTLTVSDVNESAVGAISDTDAAADSVMENAVGGTVVGVTAFAEDADLDDSVTYTLSDDAGGRFAIDANTGVVTVDGAIDREDAASYTIEVTATSTDGSTATQSYTIAIGDEDEFDVSPVTDSNVAANTLAEDATVGTTVGVVASASDGDATDGVAYAVDDGRFTVDPDGTVRVASGASFDAETEASIDIIVTATSDDGSTSNETFTLTVSDVNESAVGAISDTDAAADSVMENAVGGTVVGVTAFAEDADLDDSVTYTLSDDAGGRFAIDANTGVVTVDGAIDREDAASYTIEVTATSTDGSTATQSYTIAIGDEDEFDVSPVTDSNVAANTLAEDATVGTTVGVVASASDGDATDGVAYAVDDGRFTVDPDGTVRVASGASFDAETEASIDIIVTATSDDGSTSNETFTLTVSDVNESAVGAISDTDAAADSVMENAVGGTVVGVTAFAEDADLDDSVTYTLSDDAGGRFAIDANTGVVTVDGAIDREDAASYTIEVTATSTDGSTATQSYTIAIGDEDEFDVSPVTDSNVAANTLAEDATVGTTVGVVASASDGDATDGVAYAVDDGRFTVDPDGTVRVASGASFDAETEASIDIIVTATSDDGSTSNETFTLTVSDVNESAVGAISDTDAAADSVMENAVGGTVVGVTAFAEDADLDDSVTYTLSDDAGGRFAIDANTGVVTVDGAIDREDAASYTIEVTATSTDGSTATQSYTIAIGDEDEFDVSPVTDSNVAANTLAEDATVGTTVGVVASASDGDATDGVAYAVDDGRFTVDPDGTVRVASGASFDAETEASIDIIVTATSDDGSTSNETFTLTVSDVNDTAQVFTSGTTGSGPENAGDSTVLYTATTTDADTTGEAITYSLVDNAGGLFEIDANSGQVTLVNGQSLDYETATSHTIVIRSTDGTNSTDHNVTINVTDVNETPTDITLVAAPAVVDTVAAFDFESGTAGVNTYGAETTFSTSSAFGSPSGSQALLIQGASTPQGGGNYGGAEFDIDDGKLEAGQTYRISFWARTIDADGIIEFSNQSGSGDESSLSFDVNATTQWQYFTQTVTLDVEKPKLYMWQRTQPDFDYAIDGLRIEQVDTTNFTVNENAFEGALVGDLTATDEDIGDTATFTITNDPSGFFEVVDGNQIRVKSGATIDYETATSHDVTIEVTDSGGQTYSETITINVGEVNEVATDFTFARGTGITVNTDGGNNAYLKVTDSGNIVGGLSAMTIEMEFSSTDNSGNDIPLFSYHSGGAGDEIEIGINNDGSGNELYLEIAGELIGIVSGYDAGQLLDGDNHQVSLTWDNTAGDWEIFVDGASVASGTGIAVGQTIESGGTIVFGQEQDANDGGYNPVQIFQGTYHDARIFNDVRTADEIADNAFKEVSSTEQGLVANWRMDDDPSDGSVTDTVSGNDLTVANVTGTGWNDSTPALVTDPGNNLGIGSTLGSFTAVDPEGDTLTYSLADDAGGMFSIDPTSGEVTWQGRPNGSNTFTKQTGANNPLDGVDIGLYSKPTLVDIDNDGDLDMFAGDYNGNIDFYENTGDASNAVFTPRGAGYYGFGDDGNYSNVTFGDMDNDGDLDAFVGDSAGTITYYRNDGTESAPSFTSVGGNQFGLSSFGASSFATPTLGDLDGDGDLDMLVGHADGTFRYHENTGTNSSPNFAAATTNPFGLPDIGAYSTPSFVDIDGDGDLDVVAGEGTGKFVLLENTGTESSPSFVGGKLAYGAPVSGNFAGAALGDLDGDGDVDLIGGGGDGLFEYYENETPRTLDTTSVNSYDVTLQATDSRGGVTNETVTISTGTTGSDTINGHATQDNIMFGLEGNDTITGGNGNDVLYGGDETPTNPTFAQRSGGSNPFNGIDIGSEATPALVDIDGDGDLDMFVGETDGTVNYYENTGTATNPTYVSGTNPLNGIDVGGDSNPHFADIDGDGDMDAFVGTQDGTVNFYRNDGTANAASFTAVTGGSNPFNGMDVGYDATLDFVDIDNDGDLDAFVGTSDGGVVYRENTGTASSPSLAAGTTNPFGFSDLGGDAEYTFADIDGDGDYDALVGDQSGNLFYHENTGTASAPAFASATTNPFGFSDIGNESSPTFADIDGDGDLDLVVGIGNDDGSSSGDGQIAYFENTTELGDTLNGGAGDDILVGGSGRDTLNGGTGNDTVDYSSSTSGVDVAFASTDEWGIGGAYQNANAGGLGGDAQGDSFTSIENFVGTGHDDRVLGASSDMTYDLGAGDDIFDTVELGSGNDTVDLGAGNDMAYAGSGNDIIEGGAGDDEIWGETGDDQLSGSNGNDLFLYLAGDGSDFIDGGAGGGWVDRIDLRQMTGSIDINGNTVTGQGWTMVVDGEHSIEGQSGERLELSDDASGTIVFTDGATVTFDGIEQIDWSTTW